MKIKDIITERKAKKGKITKRQGMSNVGVGTFGDPTKADRIYALNRVMMAAACSDGTTDLSKNENAPDSESWIGKQNSFHPYTDLEQKMLKQAFEYTNDGSYTDLAKGDLKSQELADVYKTSPVSKFKGYK